MLNVCEIEGVGLLRTCRARLFLGPRDTSRRARDSTTSSLFAPARTIDTSVMSTSVPLMGAAAGGYGAAPESGNISSTSTRGRRSWTRPALVIGALVAGVAGTLALAVEPVDDAPSMFAYLGSAASTTPVYTEENPPPLPEESATQEPIVFPENIDDLDPIDETEPGVEELPASDETKSWIRVHYKPDVAEAIIADLEGEQGESFADSELGFSPVSSLGGESDYYSNTCSLPKSEAMPAGCLVQVIRPMVSCEYKTIAKNVANIPTCNGVDIPQTAPKDNDHGFEWSFTKKIPTVQVHQKTCSAGYPCQTGTNKHCWKVFGKKRCASSPIMGTCHRHWSCPYTTTGTKEVGVTLKKNEMKCQRQGFVVPKAECSECLPGFVKDGNGCTSLIEAEASKLKSKAMAICEAIPKAVDKAGDVIMATLFPSDASALGDLLADVFASATGGASSSSSLGSAKKVTGPKSRSPHGKLNKLGQKAFRSHNRRVNGARRGPDTSMDIFDNPDHHHLLRDAISATLRGEHHESKAAFLGHTPDTAELGGRDCSVMPVEILDPDDFEALEGVVFDMPWPKKLESAPYAPNSFNLELPVITFKTCTSQAPMTFPDSIGKDIIQAISDFFRPLIVGGFDELSKIDCGDILKVIEDVRKEMEKILDGVTDEIKKLKKKITGRKMLETETDPLRRAAITALMDEQEDNMAEVHAKLYEEVIFSRAMALRSLFDVPKHSEWHDDFLSNPANFHKQTALLGGHGSDVHIAALGGQSFGDRLKTLGNDLKKALEGIKNIGMGWTIEQEISVSMGFAAQSDASDQFMNGEVFDSLDVANDIADSLSAEEEIPIFASLMATTVVDIEMLMPFFLLTDGKIDFSLKSGVKTSITFGVEVRFFTP
tara:strand:+ start:1436 stop:4087 length:2652 start_codon:yes stop_codon:yes gene_type:complete